MQPVSWHYFPATPQDQLTLGALLETVTFYMYNLSFGNDFFSPPNNVQPCLSNGIPGCISRQETPRTTVAGSVPPSSGQTTCGTRVRASHCETHPHLESFTGENE